MQVVLDLIGTLIAIVLGMLLMFFAMIVISVNMGYDDFPPGLMQLFLYAVPCGLIGMFLVRPPMIGWYRSNIFITSGRGAADLLWKSIVRKIGFEMTIFFVAVVVGSLGGAVIVVLFVLGKAVAKVAARRKASQTV
jgi:hypothetical protein